LFLQDQDLLLSGGAGPSTNAALSPANGVGIEEFQQRDSGDEVRLSWLKHRQRQQLLWFRNHCCLRLQLLLK
jgi:hypothetical protein